MRKITTICDVRCNVEYALEGMISQKDDYTLEQIDALIAKCEEKYNNIYNEYCSGNLGINGRMNARKLRSLIDRKTLLEYTKHILVVTKSKSTKSVDKNLDVENVCVRILQKVDKIGYRDYLLKKSR